MRLPLKAAWTGLVWSVVTWAGEPAPEIPPVLPAENFARADISSSLRLSRDGRTIAYTSGLDLDWLMIWRDWETGKTVNTGRGANGATPIWTDGERTFFGKGVSADRNGNDLRYFGSEVGAMLEPRIEGARAGEVLMLRYDVPPGGWRQLYFIPAYPHVDRVNLRLSQSVIEVQNPGKVVAWLADCAGLVRVGVDSKDFLHRVIARNRPDEAWRVLPGLDFARDEYAPLWLTADGLFLYLGRRTPAGRWGLYRYDLTRGEAGEPILSHDRYDLVPGMHPVVAPRTRELLGIYFHTDTPRATWLDPEMGAVQKALDQALPGKVNHIISLSDDLKRMIVDSSTARDPGTYYQFDLATKALKPVFARRPWIKPAQMAEVFPASFPARDGEIIRGYLTLPAGRPAKNLPLVTWVRDGPVGRGFWTFESMAQFLANRGYAVLEINYRGSAGYGRDFQDKAKRHLSQVPQDDIADGVRWAIAQGVADATRVAIGGAGFGGTCALLGQTREPGLYRCGISINGVSDWPTHLAFRRQIDPAGSPWLWDFVGDPQRDAAELRAASPLAQVEQLATPVLLVYSPGEQVSRDDSRAYRKALERLNKPHDLLSKEDDVHGFTLTKDRTELYTRIETFLQKNMGPLTRP